MPRKRAAKAVRKPRSGGSVQAYQDRHRISGEGSAEGSENGSRHGGSGGSEGLRTLKTGDLPKIDCLSCERDLRGEEFFQVIVNKFVPIAGSGGAWVGTSLRASGRLCQKCSERNPVDFVTSEGKKVEYDLNPRKTALEEAGNAEK